MSSKRKSGNPVVDFAAGGIAGCCEALSCHPLDTIKVRMQLQGKAAAAAAAAAASATTPGAVGAASAASSGSGVNAARVAEASVTGPAKSAAQTLSASVPGQKRGFVGTGVYIFKKDGIKGLYRGLGAVIAGITPKMAIRFWSFEELKRILTPANGKLSTTGIFFSGIGAGIIEAVLVVNPTEVVKIRLQAQAHSLADATGGVKYNNAAHCLYTVIKEEGVGAIYRGVALTAARQATNQGTNFTVYTLLKDKAQQLQPDLQDGVLPGWQTSLIGLTSGALGPFSNAPLDVIKTRMQRERRRGTESGFQQGLRIARDLVRTEGPRALWRGITPRVMRVAPGQAVTFTVYERARNSLETLPIFKKSVPLTN